MYKPPTTTQFDADGQPTEMGDKFYSPANEILILPTGSNEWVRGDKLADYERPQEERFLLPQAIDPEAEPLPANDTSGWPYGRISFKPSKRP